MSGTGWEQEQDTPTVRNQRTTNAGLSSLSPSQACSEAADSHDDSKTHQVGDQDHPS